MFEKIEIDMETVIGNAMYNLYLKTNIKSLSSHKFFRYLDKLNEIIKENGCVPMINETKNMNEYDDFIFEHISDDKFLIKLKDSIDIDQLSKYRNNLPEKTIEIINDERLISTLYENTPLDEIFDKIFDDPGLLYYKVAECLSPEEYDFIKEKIGDKKCDDCRNSHCDILYTNRRENCDKWDNKILIGKYKVLKR